MLNWLRRIDDAVFSPPHKFQTILSFVVLRLGLVFEQESDATGQSAKATAVPNRATDPESSQIDR